MFNIQNSAAYHSTNNLGDELRYACYKYTEISNQLSEYTFYYDSMVKVPGVDYSMLILNRQIFCKQLVVATDHLFSELRKVAYLAKDKRYRDVISELLMAGAFQECIWLVFLQCLVNARSEQKDLNYGLAYFDKRFYTHYDSYIAENGIESMEYKSIQCGCKNSFSPMGRLPIGY